MDLHPCFVRTMRCVVKIKKHCLVGTLMHGAVTIRNFSGILFRNFAEFTWKLEDRNNRKSLDCQTIFDLLTDRSSLAVWFITGN